MSGPCVFLAIALAMEALRTLGAASPLWPSVVSLARAGRWGGRPLRARAPEQRVANPPCVRVSAPHWHRGASETATAVLLHCTLTAPMLDRAAPHAGRAVGSSLVLSAPLTRAA